MPKVSQNNLRCVTPVHRPGRMAEVYKGCKGLNKQAGFCSLKQAANQSLRGNRADDRLRKNTKTYTGLDIDKSESTTGFSCFAYICFHSTGLLFDRTESTCSICEKRHFEVNIDSKQVSQKEEQRLRWSH